MANIKAFIEAINGELRALRQKFHRVPEPSYQEHVTSTFVLQEIESLGGPTSKWRIARVGETALVASIGSGEPVIGCRFNLDGLAGCTEATGLEHSSNRVALMYACGHDVELAWAIGIARYFSAHPPVRGTIRLVFQPAEEGPGNDPLGRDGGRFLVDGGAFDGLTAIFSWHVDSAFELGQVCVREGPATVAAYDFVFDLEGVSSHLSRPAEGENPIWEIPHLINGVMDIQRRYYRRENPDEYFQCHVSQVSSGLDLSRPLDSEINTLPARATVRGSSRVLGVELERVLKQELTALARLTWQEAAWGKRQVGCKLTLNQVAVAAVNDERLVELTREAASLAGFATSSQVKFWKDAAGWTAERAPICHGYIGCGKEAGRLHTSTFYPPNEVLPVGLEMFIRQIEGALSR